MIMAQTQRPLFVDATLKCPVMSKMLSEKVEAKGNTILSESETTMNKPLI